MRGRSDRADHALWLRHQSPLLLTDSSAPGHTRVADDGAGCRPGNDRVGDTLGASSHIVGVGINLRYFQSRLVPCAGLHECRCVAGRNATASEVLEMPLCSAAAPGKVCACQCVRSAMLARALYPARFRTRVWRHEQWKIRWTHCWQVGCSTLERHAEDAVT